MEDDTFLKDVFADFSPALSDNELFVKRVERCVRAMNEVESRQREMRRKSRFVAFVAAAAGFVFGIVGVLAYPFVLRLIESLANFPTESDTSMIMLCTTVAWALTAAAVFLLTWVTYDVVWGFSKRHVSY